MPAAKEKNIWEELRKPFPKEAVGRVNKGFGDIDFIGHAAVTDRLNSVDPTWTWEPMGFTEHGTPYIDEKGGLWIKLTIGGVTRPGFGDNDGKTGVNSTKIAIGDAIKNAAMRFGVALDLWTKDELESQHIPGVPPPIVAKKMATIDEPSPEEPSVQIEKSPGQIRLDLIKEVNEAFAEKGMDDSATKRAYCQMLIDKPLPATDDEYRQVIKALKEQT